MDYLQHISEHIPSLYVLVISHNVYALLIPSQNKLMNAENPNVFKDFLLLILDKYSESKQAFHVLKCTLLTNTDAH